MTSQKDLRRRLRRHRATQTEAQRAAAQRAAQQRVARLPVFRRARRIAAYVGIRGELDPLPLLALAAAQGKRCYLPVLHPFREGVLWFCRWRPGQRMRANRFGIPEPVCRQGTLLPARRLDLVIVPLLGFDPACNRLGMGGGYYDRTFAFVRRLQHARRPRLIGFAQDTQRVETLQCNPWDVRLDMIATDVSLYTR